MRFFLFSHLFFIVFFCVGFTWKFIEFQQIFNSINNLRNSRREREKTIPGKVSRGHFVVLSRGLSSTWVSSRAEGREEKRRRVLSAQDPLILETTSFLGESQTRQTIPKSVVPFFSQCNNWKIHREKEKKSEWKRIRKKSLLKSYWNRLFIQIYSKKRKCPFYSIVFFLGYSSIFNWGQNKLIAWNI